MIRGVFRYIVILLSLSVVSCRDIVVGLAELHMEYLALEADIARLNTTVASIAEIIGQIDDAEIERIDKIEENGICIGYNIVYRGGRTLCVYHGKDGQKGEKGDDGHNGQDGHNPVLSIRQASDGIWYWTIDGQWMADSDGNKIPVTGMDGVTPIVKIEQGRWLVSIDGGISWVDFGAASSFSGSDSPILDVDYTTYENKVMFTLVDGTVFYVPRTELSTRLVCDSESCINTRVGLNEKIGFKIEGNASGTVMVDVMAGDMFKWETQTHGSDSCTVFVTALDDLCSNELFTVFINSGSKTWMKSFSFTLKKQREFTDLSETGTANCYIVSSPGKYGFDATVKGNSDIPLGGVPFSAEVIWESVGTTSAPNVGDVIQNVSYSDGYILFTAPDSFVSGNAGVAIKDMGGNILWSWHIWTCHGYDPQETETPLCGSIYMDRNLGAITKDSDNILSYGLYYLHGRKDPVMGVSANNARVVSIPNDWRYIQLSESQHTYDFFVANPMTFNSDQFHAICPDFFWDKSKSVNDPCPPGWVIPENFKFSSFSQYQKGYMLNGDSSSERLFLPSAGYNWSSSGPGAYAEYWLTGNNNGKYHHYKFDGSYAWYEEQVYDFYYSVRCCKQ